MDEFTDLELLRNHLINKDSLILNKIKDGVKYQIEINISDKPYDETLYFEKSVIGLYSYIYDECKPDEIPFPLLDCLNVVVLFKNTFYTRGVAVNVLKMENQADEEYGEWLEFKRVEPELKNIKSFTEFI